MAVKDLGKNGGRKGSERERMKLKATSIEMCYKCEIEYRKGLA